MLTFRKVLQIADLYQTRDDASNALGWQSTQDGFIAGRVVDTRAKDGGWLMQAFHDAGELELGADVGQCARVVLAPETLLQQATGGAQ